MRDYSVLKAGRGQENIKGLLYIGAALAVAPVALLFGLRLAEAASISRWLNLELAASSDSQWR